MLVKKNYKRNNIDNRELALDIENSAILIAPIIPWNIAALVPLATLNIGTSFIVYSFYLYLIPIFHMLYLKLRESKRTFLT